MKAGIPEEKIQIVSNAYDVESGDENFVLVDGHAKFDYNRQRDILTNKVQIPVDSVALIGYAVDKDLITTDFVEDNTIKQEITKFFEDSAQ